MNVTDPNPPTIIPADNSLYMQEELHLLRLEYASRLETEINMLTYRQNPALWLKERFGEDPRAVQWSGYEGYENHTWDGDEDPLYKAWMAIAGPNWAAIKSATSTGKTWFLSRVVFWFLDTHENGLVVTSAPKKEQLELHLWSEISRAFHKFKRIRPYAELTYLKLKVDGRSDDESEGDANSWMAKGFVAGVKANEESTTKAQGFHRQHMLIITEETPGMPPPTMTAFENTSTGGNNKILAVGNPDSQTDTLSMFAESSHVVEVRASAYDHPNVVVGREFIPGAVTRQSIMIRRQKYGEGSTFYQSRVRGISPAQGENALIKRDWMTQCWVHHASYFELGELNVDTKRKNALGVDVANSYNGDAASLAWGEYNILRDLHEFQCPNATHLANNLVEDDLDLYNKNYHVYATRKLAQYKIRPENVGIDAIGVGVATVNAFYDMRPAYKVIALQGGQLDEAIPMDNEKKPLYVFANLRSQMYYEAREDLQHRRIALDIPPKQFNALVKELILVEYTTKGGKIHIEPKENIKKRLGKSPNLADSFVYWNWMSKGYYKPAAMSLPFSTSKKK